MSPVSSGPGCPRCRLYSTSAAQQRVPSRSPILLSELSRRPPSRPSLSPWRQTYSRSLTIRNNPARTSPKRPVRREAANTRPHPSATSTPTKICAMERFLRQKIKPARRRQTTSILQRLLPERCRKRNRWTPTQRLRKNRSATSRAVTAMPRRIRRFICLRTKPSSLVPKLLLRSPNPIPSYCRYRVHEISSLRGR